MQKVSQVQIYFIIFFMQIGTFWPLLFAFTKEILNDRGKLLTYYRKFSTQFKETTITHLPLNNNYSLAIKQQLLTCH